MPYKLKKLEGGKTAIVKKSGKKVGESDSKSMAMKAMAARYANEKNPEKGDAKGKDNTPKHEKAESKKVEKGEGSEEDKSKK